jgi:hypothetical protein
LVAPKFRSCSDIAVSWRHNSMILTAWEGFDPDDHELSFARPLLSVSVQ